MNRYIIKAQTLRCTLDDMVRRSNIDESQSALNIKFMINIIGVSGLQTNMQYIHKF